MEAQMEESFATPVRRRFAKPEDLQRERKYADLVLSRNHVAQQLEQSTNERYSEILRRALAELDGQIAALGTAV